MTDMGYFTCLTVTAISTVTALFSARSIIRYEGSVDVGVAYFSSIVLALSTCLGFVCTLPFRHTHEMPWLPLVGAVVFGSIVLATILCCICQIKKQNASTERQ